MATRTIRTEENALVSMTQSDFDQKVKPKQVGDPKDLFMFQCPECNGVHFRHAGYVEMMMPFIRADKSKNVATSSEGVKVCVKCFKCYVWFNEQMYEVTDLIDVKAWIKAEEKLNKMTGPGGQC
jgi:hypothetical protein